MKHWLKSTVDETIGNDVVKVEVVKMVANNAFMIKEMKENVEKETRKKDRIEIVKNAVKLGMNDEDISKLTGLGIEEISKIRIKN